MPPVQCSRLDADGLSIFYRHAGNADRPVVLLLHGYPSSSFQYRNLIPLLASQYHVLAPDLPGFGFTDVPAARNYPYTFEAYGKTIAAFLDLLAVQKCAVYIFDYGAPTAFRLAELRPTLITALISQNGNAYEEGLGPFWDAVRPLWADPSPANRAAAKGMPEDINTTIGQYKGPEFPDGGAYVDPVTYTLDYALMQSRLDIMVDLFYDYRNNVAAYPAWHAWLRTHKPDVLAIWGRNDPIFLPAGAEAYKRDVPAAEVHLLEAGHFALEGKEDVFAALILEFLNRKGFAQISASTGARR